MFSVLLKPIVSEDILYDSHHLHSPLSPKIPLAHTHNTALSESIAPGNWGILTRNKARMNLGNEYFPCLGPHPQMSGAKALTSEL